MKFSALILILLIQACALNTSGLGGPGRDTIPPDDTSDFSAEVDMPGDSEDVLVDVPDPDIPVDLPVDLVPDPPPDEITPDLPADTPCAPNSTWCAGPETLEICNADGSGTTVETCHYYCLDGPPAHCAQAVPSNVNDASLYCLEGTGAMMPPPGTSKIGVNTNTGSMQCYDSYWNSLGALREGGEGLISGINFAVRTQPEGGPALAIFSFNSFNLSPEILFYAYGDNALVILSCLDVTIQGTLHVSAEEYEDSNFYPGPGGGGSGMGLGAGGAGSNGGSDDSGGGGGGSFGGYGGDGNSRVAGTAGALYANAELVPLYGGSGGGKGADDGGGLGGAGGAGGGALEISTPASIHVHGIIEACGYGGLGAGNYAAGGGGGSGGSILLEAHTIAISSSAIIAANGGGGGSGSYWRGTPPSSNSGEKGLAGLSAAPGGQDINGYDNGCDGGNGNSALDINGQLAACSEENGGGGGGGAGRIRINSKINSIAGNTQSPAMGLPGSTTTLGYPMSQ